MGARPRRGRYVLGEHCIDCVEPDDEGGVNVQKGAQRNAWCVGSRLGLDILDFEINLIPKFTIKI